MKERNMRGMTGKGEAARAFGVLLLTLLGFSYLSAQPARPDFDPDHIYVKVKDLSGLQSKGNSPVSAQDHISEIMNYQDIKMYRAFKIKDSNSKSAPANSLNRIYRVEIPLSISMDSLLQSLNREPDIEYAERIPLYYPAWVPNDSLYGYQDYLRQIGAEEAWDTYNYKERDSDVLIGVVDGGFYWHHPDLLDNVWNNLGEDADGDGHCIEIIDGVPVFDPGDVNGVDDDGNGYIDDFIGWDFVSEIEGQSGDNDPYEKRYLSHGTHVAGLAAARHNNGIGIASLSWNPKIILSAHGLPDGNVSVNPFAGIIYCAEQGADIINCSFGNHGFWSEADKEAIDYAISLGSLIIAAAGNYDEGDAFPFYPAAYPGVIAVASVDGQDRKTDYSNYGMYIDVCTPGGNHDPGILSLEPFTPTATFRGYEYGNGTSMASPITVSLAALIKAQNPDWIREQVGKQLLFSCDDISSFNPAYPGKLGMGRINAGKALSQQYTGNPEPLRLKVKHLIVPYRKVLTGPRPRPGRFSTTAPSDLVLNPGDTLDFGFSFRNFSHFSQDSGTQFVLSCDNPDITLLRNSVIDSIHVDSEQEIDSCFTIAVNKDAVDNSSLFHIEIIPGDKSLSVIQQMDCPFRISRLKFIHDENVFLTRCINTWDLGKSFYLSNFSGCDVVLQADVSETERPLFRIIAEKGGNSTWSFSNSYSSRPDDSTFQTVEFAIPPLNQTQHPILTFNAKWELGSSGDRVSGVNLNLDDGKGQYSILTPDSSVYNTENATAFNLFGRSDPVAAWTGSSDGWKHISMDLSGITTSDNAESGLQFQYAAAPDCPDSYFLIDNILVTDGPDTLFFNDAGPDMYLHVTGTNKLNATGTDLVAGGLDTEQLLSPGLSRLTIKSLVQYPAPAPGYYQGFINIRDTSGVLFSVVDWYLEVKDSLIITKLEPEPDLAQRFTLEQNYPNPFNPVTHIAYTLPRSSRVEVNIYNILGQKVMSWKPGRQNAGQYTFTWAGVNSAGRQVSSGIYLYEVKGEGFSARKKMLYLK